MSFESNGSQSSQSQPIPLSDFLGSRDDQHFVWDDADREISDEWLAPVEEAFLDPKKHKVFHHCSKEYLKPPSPFVQQGPELGDSGSTIVYRVTPPESHGYRRPLALKVIVCKENSRPPGPDSKARSDALKEVKTMSSLRHPHIVAYVASFEDYCIQTREIRRRPRGKMLFGVNQRIKRHILGIAMYPPAQCNLHTFMDEVFQSPKEAEVILPCLHTYFGCLAQAVAYLHRQSVRIRHKDIKPDNIVIDDFGLPVLTDFGLSKHFETGQYSEGPTPKTLKYADPEAMHEERRDERSDIFSLGCVFLEMATVLLGRPTQFAEEQLANGNANGGDGHSVSSSGSGSGATTTTTTTAAEFKYSESLHNLDAYLTTLSLLSRDVVASDPSREASVRAVLAVLPQIRRMMCEAQTRRPEAHQLYPWFRHLYDVYDMPGPCPNCEEERRSGRAIPSRSGSRSPTLTRSGTMSHGGGGGGSQPLMRRGTAASMVTVGSLTASSQPSQGSYGFGASQVDGRMDAD